MDLEWVRHDENTVVDDLSNGKYEAFDQSLREEVKADKMEWRVLGDLQKRSGEQLYEGIKSLKLQGRREGALRSIAPEGARRAKSSVGGG